MSEAIFMIDGETYRIPQLRRNLPFINQPGGIARQKTSGADTSQSHILLHILRVVHIQDTPGMLLGSCRFTTPFGTFYKNGAATLQFKQQNLICYSTLIFHSHICFIQLQRYKKNRQFGYLWIFCSAICGHFVRLFVDINSPPDTMQPAVVRLLQSQWNGASPDCEVWSRPSACASCRPVWMHRKRSSRHNPWSL